jgi:FkbM family methyltransferase
MDNFFDKAVHFLGKTNPNTFIMNIGAMDGVMFDELIGYTNMYDFKGLYVEPIPYLFEKLKGNIPNEGNLFENSAISDYNGEIEMITINKDVIDQGLVHSCFYGMSAVYPPKNGLGSEFDRPTVEAHGQKIIVKSITFDKLLRKHNINNIDIIKIDAEGHDYIIFKQIDFDEFRPKVVRLEWINLTEKEQNDITNKFKSLNYKYEINGQDIVGIPDELYNEILGVTNQDETTENKKLQEPSIKNSNSKVTLVTGLWDIGRNSLENGWSRSFDHYIEKFKQLLSVEENMIIFGDNELQKIVFQIRNQENTQFILRDLSWFKRNDYFEKIQNVRTNPKWYNQVGWLTDSTQAKLEMYNPLVMSKVFLLHDAKILDKFDSEYMFWIDAGLTNTVHPGYFTHDKILNKLPNLVTDFHFICFPYEAVTEIHGFDYKEIINYCGGANVNKVARAGFFGGRKEIITQINSIYYSLLNDTLDKGLMGTEESLFTIMVYKHPEIIKYSEIEDNGLIGKFFEDLKNTQVSVMVEKNQNYQPSNFDINKTALYVIGFNSPKQFETLIDSMLLYDSDFIHKPKKYLLDNSTDLTTTPRYKELCERYDFEHIKPKENLGICGGRQFIAEHFEATGFDYYFFFEDDMFFFNGTEQVCRNGFPRYIKSIYEKTLRISNNENFDYLKFNFSEFFGDNSTQWSWYNVPQTVRESYWPTYSKLPQIGTDPNAPKVEYKNIKSYDGLAYATGEIYYCNWPQVVSREGNKKMFLKDKWAHPYEQTWMSYMYQELKKDNLNFGLLLASPTEHNRFEHYEANLRKES